MKKKLTAKEAGFVDSFMETKNATESVRRNYEVADNAPGTIAAMGHQILERPHIISRIEELKNKFVEDSYEMYESQKKLAKSTSNDELKNKIYNKVLDRAGFTPTYKTENKSIKAKFIIKRGV